MKAKMVFLGILLAISFTVFGQEGIKSSDQLLSEAKGVAAKENKLVFVIFKASWCGWCRKFDSSLNDPSVKKYFNDHFIIVHLDVAETGPSKSLETPGASAYFADLHAADQGVPYWLVLDKNGKTLANSEMKPGNNTGCPATADEVGYLIGILKKWTTLSQEEEQAIKSRFLKNGLN